MTLTGYNSLHMDGSPENLAEQLLLLRKRVEALEEEVSTLRSGKAEKPVSTAVVGMPPPPVAPPPAQPKVAPPPPPPAQNLPPTPAASKPEAASGVASAPPLRPVAPPTQPVRPISTQQAAPRNTQTLESRLGSQIFNRIGVLAILIGAAWALKLAIDNQWIGAAGRIVLGMIAGSAVILWSERFRRKGYDLFSYSMKAIGSGVLYLSLWASFQLYHLLPAGAVFGAMVLVTAWNGWMAWVQDSQVLAIYALAGAYLTPMLLSTGENHPVFLFSYLLLICVAAIGLLAAKPWPRLLIGVIPVTVFYYIGWYSKFFSADQFGITLFFTLLFFLLFASIPLVRPMADSVILTIWAPLTAGVFGALAFYSVLEDSARHSWEAWAAVLLAVFYLGLIQVQRRVRPQVGTEAIHHALAIVFLTIAIPLKMHGRWIVMGWLMEGAALHWAVLYPMKESAQKVRTTLQCLAAGALCLGYCGILFFPQWRGAATTPWWNHQFAAEIFAVVVLCLVAWLGWKSSPAEYARLTASVSCAALNMMLLVAVLRELWQVYSPNPSWLQMVIGLVLVAHCFLSFVVTQWTKGRLPGIDGTIARLAGRVTLAFGYLLVLCNGLHPDVPWWNRRSFGELTAMVLLFLLTWTIKRDTEGAFSVLANTSLVALNLLLLVTVFHEVELSTTLASASGHMDRIDRLQVIYGLFLMVHAVVSFALAKWGPKFLTVMDRSFLRLMGGGTLALGYMAILFTNPEVKYPVFNLHFVTEMTSVLLLAASVWMLRSEEQDAAGRKILYSAIIAINVMILASAYHEIFGYWAPELAHGEGLIFAEFTFSAFMMLHGAALLAIGFWKRTAFVRWQGLVLLVATIGKVFLYDMRSLSQGYRVLSFIGLGALLMAVSFVYQKDWLGLKTAPRSEE